MTNVYLDIDGVLLDGDRAANGADEFITYVTDRYPDTTYWLSGRCSGDAAATVNQLKSYFGPATLARLDRIKPTVWPLVKTQAIEFGSPFLWVDDVLGFADEEALERHGVIRSFVLVDLQEEPEQLLRLLRGFPRP